MRLIFDIETDGLDDASIVHTIVIKDADTGDKHSYANQPGYASIEVALEHLEAAEVLIGQNILEYDVPTLRKLYPHFNPKGLIRDTLIMSRLIWTDLANEDFRRKDQGVQFPPALIGSHSLKAWGFRLGILKGLFAEQTDWKQWSKEMQTYCEQDVEVTDALLKLIESQRYSETAIQLEHDFAWVIYLQKRHGFRFNEQAAGKLAAELIQRRQQITEKLREVVPAKRIEMKTPQFYTASSLFETGKWIADGETKSVLLKKLKELGVPKTAVEIWPGPNKFKLLPFNPGSRQQVGAYLISQGWVPTKFTETGQAQVDETTLEGLQTPAADLLKEYFVVNKLLGQLSDGDNSWLKLAKNGRLHGQVNTNGAVTGRCAHFKPNIGQVPAVMVGKDKQVLHDYAGRWGWECRSLFLADDGDTLVGADASGLELRCLAHYIAKYDGGAYGKILLEGDIHTVNQQAAGIDTRAESKTFIYSYLYGAGNHKIGVNCGGVKPEEIPKWKAHKDVWAQELKMLRRKQQKNPGMKFTETDVALSVKGAVIRKRFETKTPALAKLKEAIAQAVRDRGYLVAIDGRKLHVRSAHSALNTLLQACGAILVKMATVILYKKAIAAGWQFGREFSNVAHIHDEIQTSVQPALAEQYGNLAVDSIREAGTTVNFRVPLSGEWKQGPTWAATH